MRDFGDATASQIDAAVAKKVRAAEEKARGILQENLVLLKKLAKLLNERETLDRNDLDEFFSGRNVPENKPLVVKAKRIEPRKRG